MPLLPQKPPPFVRGQPAPGADLLNQLTQAIIRQIRPGMNTQVNYYNDRVVINSDQPNRQQPPTSAYYVQFVVLEELDDYLLCAFFSPPVNQNGVIPQIYSSELGQGQLALTYVAKPYLLQRTPWDNQTVTIQGNTTTFTYTGLGQRNAVTPTGTISQMISLPYFPGDIVTAVLGFSGYKDPNGSPVPWMDVNEGGRTWASGSQGSGPSGPPSLTFVGVPSVSASQIIEWNGGTVLLLPGTILFCYANQGGSPDWLPVNSPNCYVMEVNDNILGLDQLTLNSGGLVPGTYYVAGIYEGSLVGTHASDNLPIYAIKGRDNYNPFILGTLNYSLTQIITNGGYKIPAGTTGGTTTNMRLSNLMSYQGYAITTNVQGIYRVETSLQAYYNGSANGNLTFSLYDNTNLQQVGSQLISLTGGSPFYGNSYVYNPAYAGTGETSGVLPANSEIDVLVLNDHTLSQDVYVYGQLSYIRVG